MADPLEGMRAKAPGVKPGKPEQEASLVPLVMLSAQPGTPWVGLNCPRCPSLPKQDGCHFSLTAGLISRLGQQGWHTGWCPGLATGALGFSVPMDRTPSEP